LGAGRAGVDRLGISRPLWNHVIPDSGVKVLLTLPLRALWRLIRVSGDKSVSAGRRGRSPPGRHGVSKDNVENHAPDFSRLTGSIAAGEGLRAGLEIASRVESVALIAASLGKRFT